MSVSLLQDDVYDKLTAAASCTHLRFTARVSSELFSITELVYEHCAMGTIGLMSADYCSFMMVSS